MGNQSGKFNKTVIFGAVILIIIGATLWWYFLRQKSAKEPAPIKTSEDVVGAVTAPELEVGSNPVQNKVPEVNPVDRANPFKDSYRNPFE